MTRPNGRGRGWRRRSLADRFWEKVAIAGPDACWIWTGATSQKRGGRRGVIWAPAPSRRQLLVHRVALALAEGRDPVGPAALEAAHACDVPLCCNPRHLSWLDHGANMADYANKYGGIARPKIEAVA